MSDKWAKENPQKSKEIKAAWYQANKVKQLSNLKEKRIAMKAWYKEFKSSLKCEQCDETHIACLEFHHVDPLQKDVAVATTISRGWSKEKIMQEVEKCIVLCANCHRKLHWS